MKLVTLCIVLLVAGKVYSCTAQNCQVCVTNAPTRCSLCNSGYYLPNTALPPCTKCVDGCDECVVGSFCSTCKAGFYKDALSLCKSCQENCTACSLVYRFGDPTPTSPTCSACKSGMELQNNQCVDVSAQDSKGNTMVVTVTVPFGLVMITLAVIAYCLQARMESVPDSFAATLMGGGAPTAAGSSSMMQMAGAHNGSFGGFQGAAIA